jgi:hypothetical protein
LLLWIAFLPRVDPGTDAEVGESAIAVCLRTLRYSASQTEQSNGTFAPAPLPGVEQTLTRSSWCGDLAVLLRRVCDHGWTKQHLKLRVGSELNIKANTQRGSSRFARPMPQAMKLPAIIE